MLLSLTSSGLMGKMASPLSTPVASSTYSLWQVFIRNPCLSAWPAISSIPGPATIHIGTICSELRDTQLLSGTGTFEKHL